MDQKTFYSRLQSEMKFKGFSDERIVKTASGMEVDGYITVTFYRNTVTIEQLGHVLEESNWNKLFMPNMIVLTAEKVIDYLHHIRTEKTASQTSKLVTAYKRNLITQAEALFNLAQYCMEYFPYNASDLFQGHCTQLVDGKELPA